MLAFECWRIQFWESTTANNLHPGQRLWVWSTSNFGAAVGRLWRRHPVELLGFKTIAFHIIPYLVAFEFPKHSQSIMFLIAASWDRNTYSPRSRMQVTSHSSSEAFPKAQKEHTSPDCHPTASLELSSPWCHLRSSSRFSLQFHWLSAGYGQCQGTIKRHSGRASWTDWRGHSVRFSSEASSQVCAILRWCGIGGYTATFWSSVCCHSSLRMSHSPTLLGRTLISKRLVIVVWGFP